MAKFITFRNDFDFSNKEISNKQAVAFKSDSDQSIIYKCAFYSNQDTLYANSGRQIYKDCLIAGNIDFIFGDTSTAYFTNCDIVSLKKPINSESIVSNGYVCATKGNGVKYGYIFNECNFTSDSLLKDNTMSLARPWGQSSVVSIINSNISSVYSTSSYNPQRVSRYDQMGGNSPCEAFFREYNNSGEGAINNKVDGMSLLTSEEANDSNNLSIIFSKENGKIRYESNWDIDINKIKD